MSIVQHFAQVHGKRIAYLEAGTGDPIVLLHGTRPLRIFGVT